MVTKGESGGGDKLGVQYGINRYKLLYTKEINSKCLLYSTGNYMQCNNVQWKMENNLKKNMYISLLYI